MQKLKNLYHFFNALFWTIFYGFPARKMTVIGVTGTDGKTTTVSLIYTILQEAGIKCAMISTNGAEINGKQVFATLHTTTPSSKAIQQFLQQANKENCKYCVIEVSSHAINQNRIVGCNFKIGILTNITHEHLDYHGSLDEYRRVKMSFMKKCPQQIYIEDRKLSLEMINTLKKRGIDQEFNLENAKLAVATAQLIGISETNIIKGLSVFNLPVGRFEFINKGQPFNVIIDFALTPNAFKVLLPEVKKITKGKLIHVFGAAGDRDQTKRPILGEIAEQYDDIIILTCDDTHTEKLETIIAMIKKGIKKGNCLVELDRKQAIEKAISLAKKGDTVLITGMGHQITININEKEIPWNDRQVTEEILTKYGYK